MNAPADRRLTLQAESLLRTQARIECNAGPCFLSALALIVCGYFAALTTRAAETTAPAPSTQVLFTPEQDATGAIVRAIAQAKHEILVQAFSFTSKNIARALQRARARGVQVEVLIDREQFERGNAFVARDLVAARVSIRLDGQHGAAHNKVIIIDGQSSGSVVFAGSFNFSHAAQTKNAENLLIIRGDTALAKRYRENWLRHRSHATRLD